MAITTKGRSEELEKAKKKIIKFNPMGKTAQKEAAKKNLPEKKVNLQAAVDTMFDTKQPMKKQRLEDSVVGKKLKFIGRSGQELAKGGRAGFKSGSKGCKLAMKGKGRAYGKNS